MAGRRYFLYMDVLPFSAMVCMECINVGLNTLFKAATLHGMSMSYHVFIVYSYASPPSPHPSPHPQDWPPGSYWVMSEQLGSHMSVASEGPALSMERCLSRFSIAIAVTMGAIFLRETLHLGSLIRAAIISIGFSIGFYTVMRGKAKEEKAVELEEQENTNFNSKLSTKKSLY